MEVEGIEDAVVCTILVILVVGPVAEGVEEEAEDVCNVVRS